MSVNPSKAPSSLQLLTESDGMGCHWGVLVLWQTLRISLSMVLVDLQIVSAVYWSEPCICHDAVGQDSFSFPPFFWPLCCLGDIMCVTVYSLVVFPIHGLWLSLLYLTILFKISYIGFGIAIPCTRFPTSISVDSYIWTCGPHPTTSLDLALILCRVICNSITYPLLTFTPLCLILHFVFSLACLLWLIFESGCLTVPSSFAFGTLLYLYLPIISNLYYLRFSQCYLLSTHTRFFFNIFFIIIVIVFHFSHAIHSFHNLANSAV